jgi:hypothetical protein
MVLSLIRRLMGQKETVLYFLAAPFEEPDMPQWQASLLLVKVTNEEQLYFAFSNLQSATELQRRIGDDQIKVIAYSQLDARIQHDFTRHNLFLLTSPTLVAQYWEERGQFPFERYRAEPPLKSAV